MLAPLSVVAFAAMIAGIAGLYINSALLASRPLALGIQVAAFALMVAARLTFGRRSFHASADPTGGGVVTTGPYGYIRHPIYAAVIYFTWAGAMDHFSGPAAACAALISAGAAVRMFMEERLLISRYPDYVAYKARVKRIFPFVV